MIILLGDVKSYNLLLVGGSGFSSSLGTSAGSLLEAVHVQRRRVLCCLGADRWSRDTTYCSIAAHFLLYYSSCSTHDMYAEYGYLQVLIIHIITSFSCYAWKVHCNSISCQTLYSHASFHPVIVSALELSAIQPQTHCCNWLLYHACSPTHGSYSPHPHVLVTVDSEQQLVTLHGWSYCSSLLISWTYTILPLCGKWRVWLEELYIITLKTSPVLTVSLICMLYDLSQICP